MSEAEAFCPKCEDYCATSVASRDETYKVRGRDITVAVESDVCAVCGERLGSDETDQKVLDAVYLKYRQENDLLTPAQIKDIRKRYHLSQKSFAALLGMSEATINRYEQGGLQDPSHDTAMRAFENAEVVRDALTRRGNLLSARQRKQVEVALGAEDTAEDRILDMFGDVSWPPITREISINTGFKSLDTDRFAAVVLWFCDRLNEVSRTAINKLLFYADFLNYKQSTVSITGTTYRRLQYGPAPADYEYILSLMESGGLLLQEEREVYGGHTGFYYSSGKKADKIAVEFTSQELKVLEHVADTLGSLSAKDISARSHDEPAWSDTEDGQLISFELARQLSLSLPD